MGSNLARLDGVHAFTLTFHAPELRLSVDILR